MAPDGPALGAWLDQEDAQVRTLIRKHGFTTQYVQGGSGRNEPAFGYTIGLFGLGHPELVIVGLGPHKAHALLEAAVTQVKDGNDDLWPGRRIELRGQPYIAEASPNPGDVVFSANRFYDRPPEVSVPVYQLAWAVDGLWPWEPAYPHDTRPQPRPGDWTA